MRLYISGAVGAFTAYITYHAVMVNGSYAVGAAIAEALIIGAVAAVHTLKALTRSQDARKGKR